MGAAYSWHPRIDVVNSRWPNSQSLLEDELFSSWLIRNAFAHGCSPLSLTGSLWPGWRCWTVDIDRGIPADQVRPLSILSGISMQGIYGSTLHPIAKILNPGLDEEQGVWPWVLTLGTRNRSRAAGLQCCPLCLAEGTSYYRISSRLAWHTCCELHQTRLIDRCPKCQAPLQPQKLEQSCSDCGSCDRCGSRLEVGLETLGFNPAALAFQMACDDALRGRGGDSECHCDPYDWFYRSRFVCGILRVAAVNGSKSFSAFREVFNLGKMPRPVTGLPLEMLPVHERMSLLAATWKIMITGEKQLGEAIAACSLPRGSLVLPTGEVPRSVRIMVDALPPGVIRKRETAAMRSPATRATVEKMWARLKRRMLRDG